MKKRNSIFEKIALFLNAFSIMFGYIFPNQIFLVCFSLIFSIIVVRPKSLKINYYDKAIFILVLIFVINSLFSINFTNSFKFIFMFILCWLNTRILVDLKIDWRKKIIDYIWFFSLIHTLCVIIHFLKPEIIYSFTQLFFNSETMSLTQQLANLGSFSGICNQTGLAGFLVSIFIIISFIKIDYSDKKTLYVIFSFLGFLALFLTGKRGFVLFDVLIILLYFIFFQKGNISKKIIYFMLLIFFVFIGIILLSKFGILDSFLNKIVVLQNSNDLSNGRNALWSRTFEIFENKFVFGNGINTIDIVLGNYSHNIYIQLLAELGMFLFLPVIIWMINNLLCAVRKYKKSHNVYDVLSIFIQFLFLLYGFTGNPFYGSTFLCVYFLGVCLLCERKEV